MVEDIMVFWRVVDEAEREGGSKVEYELEEAMVMVGYFDLRKQRFFVLHSCILKKSSNGTGGDLCDLRWKPSANVQVLQAILKAAQMRNVKRRSEKEGEDEEEGEGGEKREKETEREVQV